MLPSAIPANPRRASEIPDEIPTQPRRSSDPPLQIITDNRKSEVDKDPAEIVPTVTPNSGTQGNQPDEPEGSKRSSPVDPPSYILGVPDPQQNGGNQL